MSKIAELLKLEAQKKSDSVGKGKQRNVDVSIGKGTEVEVDKSIGKLRQVKVSIGKQTEVEVSKKNFTTEVSPTKNFTKTPNSIVARAIPEKYFRGLSKHTYDVLWLRTRGAIVPQRTIQLTKDELVKMTGLSKDGIQLHLKYLKDAGLIKSRPAVGHRKGWEYEVLTLEELELEVKVSKGKEVNVSKSNQTLPLPTGEDLLTFTHSNPNENKEDSEPLNTLINTKNNDDDPLAKFRTLFDQAALELTGRKLSAADWHKMDDLAELLILELKVAAKRTGSVSSVPAFLTEVLRRQFFNSRQSKSPKLVPDTVGKSHPETFEIKSLDAQGRELALEELREFAGESFLDDFKKYYTDEDFDWIKEQLKKG